MIVRLGLFLLGKRMRNGVRCRALLHEQQHEDEQKFIKMGLPTHSACTLTNACAGCKAHDRRSRLYRERVAFEKYHVQQRIDSGGVVAYAAKIAQLFESAFDAERRAVGAVRGHRFHYVGDGQHAGFRQNGVAFEFARIAAAVEPFVVLANNLCNRQGKIDVFQNFVTLFGVGFYHLVFQSG